MYIEFDCIKDDLCHGCKFAVLKKDGTFGTFERRYGCTCRKRIDYLHERAENALKAREYQAATAHCFNLFEMTDFLKRYGWFNPDPSCVCCIWKESSDE